MCFAMEKGLLPIMLFRILKILFSFLRKVFLNFQLIDADLKESNVEIILFLNIFFSFICSFLLQNKYKMMFDSIINVSHLDNIHHTTIKLIFKLRYLAHTLYICRIVTHFPFHRLIADIHHSPINSLKYTVIHTPTLH